MRPGHVFAFMTEYFVKVRNWKMVCVCVSVCVVYVCFKPIYCLFFVGMCVYMCRLCYVRAVCYECVKMLARRRTGA